jgi:hypothetical protein
MAMNADERAKVLSWRLEIKGLCCGSVVAAGSERVRCLVLTRLGCCGSLVAVNCGLG